jgi:hypothetical protein
MARHIRLPLGTCRRVRAYPTNKAPLPSPIEISNYSGARDEVLAARATCRTGPGCPVMPITLACKPMAANTEASITLTRCATACCTVAHLLMQNRMKNQEQ